MPFRLPPPPERADRLAAVLHVLYLIFNEGYASTSGPRLHRVDLSAEAIRLTRLLHRLLPDDGEVDRAARADAAHRRPPAGPDRPGRRAGADGRAGPRPVGRGRTSPRASRWSPRRCPRGATGPYQLQAAIAAVHDEAPSAGGDRLAADPRAVRGAAADVRQPGGGAQPRGRGGDGARPARRARAARRRWPRTSGSPRDHRLHAVRAHLLELAGDAAGGPRGLPGRGRADAQPAAAALPARPRSPAVSASTRSALIARAGHQAGRRRRRSPGAIRSVTLPATQTPGTAVAPVGSAGIALPTTCPSRQLDRLPGRGPPAPRNGR